MTTEAISDIRGLAAETFARLGWPTTKIEEWRYTNLAPLQKVAWHFDERIPAHAAAEIDLKGASLAKDAALELVFFNGRLLGTPKPADWWKPAEAQSIAELDHNALEHNAMLALNTANAQDGARIEIPANTIVEGFVHLLFVGGGDGVWSHPRNLIVVGRNAQVAVVETYVGSGSYFTNAVTEIVAGAGAVVDHYRIERESPSAFHIGNVFIREERAASVTSHNVAIGASLARNEMHVTLAGEGSTLVLDGLFAGTGNQHLDNRTVIDHVTPHCESHELYKGVLDGTARGIFDGKIVVHPGAQKTVSRQENRNLLLSESAVVDSKPTLEIHNDDVKCNHGSTIGQIEEEPLFYLRSRGIGESQARAILVEAFAGEIVERMKVAPVREGVRAALLRFLSERPEASEGGIS